MTYTVGSLVKACGREWVVLPESEEDMLVLRPLGGTEDEVAGVYLPLQTVEDAPSTCLIRRGGETTTPPGSCGKPSGSASAPAPILSALLPR